MSHEIHVLARSGDAVDERALIDAFAMAGWQAPPDASGLVYANPNTGARASIEPLTIESLPRGFRHLELGLVLNYVRPSWLGDETIPAFAAALAGAGALVLDPQSGAPAPVAPDAVSLTASWRTGNEAAIAAARAAGGDIPWLEPTRSLAWWRHQRALPRLQMAFAADHYVPSIRLVKQTGDEHVLRMMSWPDHVPALLPDCDQIVLMRSSPTSGFTILGVAPGELVRARLEGVAEQLGPEIDGVRDTVRVGPGLESTVADRLASVALEPFEGFESVAPDGFVDVPPSAARDG
ncbi:MAG TPA: hypothetical protein VFV72_02115 [Candidatus Limnocylindrales bacterium]|nr:hypothetical protein [Candidatus Limnocylindrales bacterium]